MARFSIIGIITKLSTQAVIRRITRVVEAKSADDAKADFMASVPYPLDQVSVVVTVIPMPDGTLLKDIATR